MEHSRHIHAGVVQGQRRLQPGRAVREDDGPLSRQHAEPLGIDARGGGEHDPGPVVIGERDRPLVRPRRQDNAFRPDVVDARDRLCALIDQHVAVVIDTEGGGSGQEGGLFSRGKFADQGSDFVARR